MRTIWKATIIVAAIVIVVAGAALLISPDKRRLDQGVRDRSGSDFIELSEGYVEYEVGGPESGTPVVLVHGLSVPMFDWDRQFAFLTQNGFRTVRYNHYGRGLSDRPRGDYDSERYTLQLKDLIDQMGWEKVNLVGHSMGCAVVAEFALRYPGSVDRIVHISPVLHLADGNTGISLARIPIVGDLAAKTILARIIGGRADELFIRAGVPEAAEYSAIFQEQMRYRGFSRSVKSLFRGEMVDDLSDTYRQLDGSNTLAIRGVLDESVSDEKYAVIVGLMPAMESELLAGIGHMPTMEAADQTNELIAEFLRR